MRHIKDIKLNENITHPTDVEIKTEIDSTIILLKKLAQKICQKMIMNQQKFILKQNNYKIFQINYKL